MKTKLFSTSFFLLISISIFSQDLIKTGSYSGQTPLFNNALNTTVVIKEKNKATYKQEYNNLSCSGNLDFKTSFGNTLNYNNVISNTGCLPMQNVSIIVDSPDDLKLSATFTNPINNVKETKTIALKRDGLKMTTSPKTLSVLLIELESNIKWEAVDASWKQKRDRWINKSYESKTPNQVANDILDLESNIKWESVEAAWKTRRDAWIKACENAISINQVAFLLQELETNIKWTAVQITWKNRRDSWMKDCQNANK